MTRNHWTIKHPLMDSSVHFTEALFEGSGWYTGHKGIWGDITSHDCPRCDDRSVANRQSAHYQSPVPHPDISANESLPLHGASRELDWYTDNVP